MFSQHYIAVKNTTYLIPLDVITFTHLIEFTLSTIEFRASAL